MRIAVDEWGSQYCYRILVDGADLGYIKELDTDEGWVRHFVRDENGLLRHENGEAIIMKTYGYISILWRLW